MCDIMSTIEKKKNYFNTIVGCVRECESRYFYFPSLLLNIEVLKKRTNECSNTFVILCFLLL